MKPVPHGLFATLTWSSQYPFLGLLLPHLRRLSLEVPYCEPCMAHIGWKEGGGWLGGWLRGLVVGFLVLLATGFCLLLGVAVLAIVLEAAEVQVPSAGRTVAALLALPAVLSGFAAGAAAVRSSLRARSPAVQAPHTRASGSFEVLEWSREYVLLALHNATWSREFLGLNSDSKVLERRPVTAAVVERWLLAPGIVMVIYVAYEAWQRTLR